MGQHRQRRRARPPHRQPRALRPDLAADRYGVRRQDGQDRRRRRLAQRRPPQPLRLLAVFPQHRRRRRRPFLRLFTDLPLAEIARLEALRGAEINDAKVVLANETTTLAHGAEAAATAAETARRTFAEGGIGGDLPTLDLPRAELERGIPVFQLFTRSGLAASNGEARRLIKGGGARLNDAAVADETRLVTLADVDAQGIIKLSAGKKRHAVVRLA